MSAESAGQFVDTNVLAYAHDRHSGEKHDVAKGIIDELWISGSGCLSIQVLQEFYVTVTRKITTPISPTDAEQIVQALSQWRVHAPDANDVLNAIAVHQRYQISFWDAMIFRSAARLGCDVVLTEDLNNDQQIDGVLVRNPFL